MKYVDGILLIYHRPPTQNAPTVTEHVDSFSQYSQFKIRSVNTALGYPTGLSLFSFPVIVLHHTLFWQKHYPIDKGFHNHLEKSKSSYKIAFFQDEYDCCQQRFTFISKYKIDCIYTLVEQPYWPSAYLKYVKVPKLVYTLAGYVSEGLLEKAKRFAKPRHIREVDVGYRARQLAVWMGQGSQEKHEIALKFLEHADGSALKLDVKVEEKDRLYGDAWYRFLGNCKACLGVEAGVSIFDLEDEVRLKYEDLSKQEPITSLQQMPKELLDKWEDNVFYRTISPRHFEAAAFRVCQVLYEGKYSGILKPMVHYIPLRKDFSNLKEVIRLLRDEQICEKMTENCYHDLIASGEYSYKNFIQGFDQELFGAGFRPSAARKRDRTLSSVLVFNGAIRLPINILNILMYGRYPGKSILVRIARPFVIRYWKIRTSLELRRRAKASVSDG